MRLLLLIIACINLAANLLNGQDQRTVTVTGMAESTVEPDAATIELGVSVRNNELVTAKATVDQTIKKVAEAITAAGAKRESVRTSNINFSSYFGEDDTDFSDPTYVVDRDIATTIPIALVDSVLDAATKAGANQINGIRYSISNDSDFSRKTLDAAIKNAKEHAQYLATAFDAKLGKVLRIQGDRADYPTNLSLAVSAPQDPFGGESYVPDKISITRTITVVFELTD